jgi:transcriptional regulator with XRE-family HTH domain
MTNSKLVLLPRLLKILEELGENIKLARLRRQLSVEQVAERAGISRSTLWHIEKGAPTVSLGSYAQVLFILGLEKNLADIAADDVLGRKLQDAEILVKKRARKRIRN